jgi:hypothetical protein
MKHPKTSAIYWTNLGTSINRVINGSTKKLQNTHSEEKVDCPEIDKTHQWVKYVTKQKISQRQVHTTRVNQGGSRKN